MYFKDEKENLSFSIKFSTQLFYLFYNVSCFRNRFYYLSSIILHGCSEIKPVVSSYRQGKKQQQEVRSKIYVCRDISRMRQKLASYMNNIQKRWRLKLANDRFRVLILTAFCCYYSRRINVKTTTRKRLQKREKKPSKIRRKKWNLIWIGP